MQFPIWNVYKMENNIQSYTIPFGTRLPREAFLKKVNKRNNRFEKMKKKKQKPTNSSY